MYNHRKVPQETLEKVRLSWSLIDKWTFRCFARHFELLNRAARIIDVPRCNYFNLLRFVFANKRVMHDSHHTMWDSPISICPSALSEMLMWTNVVLKNAPRPAPEPYSWALMAIDASSAGWGYVARDEVTDGMWRYGTQWDVSSFAKHDLVVQHSAFTDPTFTKPWGIFLAKSDVMSRIIGSRHFRIGTDDVDSQRTFNNRYHRSSFNLNNAAKLD